MRKVGRPECDCAVLMAQVDDGVVVVLAHRAARTVLGTVLDDKLPSRRILVLQVPCVALYAYEPGKRAIELTLYEPR